MKLPSANTTTCYEDDLLICCARVSQTSATRERLERLLRKPIDWQTVLDRSWWHRIRPLTYLHLSHQPAGIVPTAFLDVIRSHARELELRNQQLMDMQRRIAEMFEQASLRMLVFKGPTLAIDAYGDLSLRECGDLDMLIGPNDFPRVKTLLLEKGFTCLWDEVSSRRKRQLFACEFQRDGVELDIHWDLAPGWHNYRVDFDSLWENGHPFEPGCQATRKLRTEDSLEVLCMHGTRHWWERLRWICDIAELVNQSSSADWENIEAKAAEASGQRSVWLGLCLASDLLDANLPLRMQVELERLPVVRRMASQVGHWLGDAEHAAERRRLTDRFLFRMRLCESWRERLPQLAHYLVSLPARSVNWNP